MMELQKYYTGSHMDAIYLASEADAAFAAEIAALKREHAEEIERLKAGQRQIEMIRDWNDAHFKEIEKQAERYEKLRGLNVREFQSLYMRNIRGDGRFDDLVDQLPASGEKP